MAKFERGKAISAGALNRTVQEANAGANVTGDGANVAKGPGGQGISIPRLIIPQPNKIRAQFIGTERAPVYGIVEIHDGWASRAADTIGQCRIPSQSGFASVGALLNDANNNQVPWVQWRGVGHILFDYDNVPETYQSRTRYRLGARKNSHIAHYDRLGPFLLVKDLGVQWGVYHIGLVHFTGRRGDEKIADTDDRVDGPYYTYAWAPGYDITETAPGLVSVDLV